MCSRKHRSQHSETPDGAYLRGTVRIGPRMTLSHPMIVVSVATGVLVWVGLDDFTTVGRVVDFFSAGGAAGVTALKSFATTLSGAAFTIAGVDDEAATPTESTFDAPPG